MTKLHYVDRDQAIALQRAAHDTLEPERAESDDAFAQSIATLQRQINEAREQLARMKAELDALALGGHIQA